MQNWPWYGIVIDTVMCTLILELIAFITFKILTHAKKYK